MPWYVNNSGSDSTGKDFAKWIGLYKNMYHGHLAD